MPGVLRCGAINLNDPAVVRRVVEALRVLAVVSKYPLAVRGTYHFAIPTGPIATVPGWYLICDQASQPLYVGTAENLNARLNSDEGSRDGFANPKRTSDPVRNFVKSFSARSILSSLSVITISEPEFCRMIEIAAPLVKRDRENVEKVLDIFRHRVLARNDSIVQDEASAKSGAAG